MTTRKSMTERYAEVRDELRRRPEMKGTRWYADRVNELRSIMRRLDVTK